MPQTPKKQDAEVEGQAKPPDPPDPPAGDTLYKFVGEHATILESGQPLGSGEYVTLTGEEISGHNQRLFDEGHLVDATGISVPEQQTAGTQSTTEQEGSEK
jgi:hypothetical protein